MNVVMEEKSVQSAVDVINNKIKLQICKYNYRHSTIFWTKIAFIDGSMITFVRT